LWDSVDGGGAPKSQNVGTTLDSIDELFRGFSRESSKFVKEISVATGTSLGRDPRKAAKMNLIVAREIFSKWSIEIIVLLFSSKTLGFEDMKRALGDITSRVLSEKLKMLEAKGLVERQVLNTRPLRVHYALTDMGLNVARLGEPIFLYLILKSGLIESKGP